MTRLVGVALLATCVIVMAPLPALAQASSTGSAEDSHPATATVSGTTGLWFTPSADVLPARAWSFSLARVEANDGQGFLNISNLPASFGIGVGGRTEVFGSWNVLTRLDRDTRPLFFPGAATPGTGGGVTPTYPLDRGTFVSTRGDLSLGAKLNLASQSASQPLALALRGTVKLPTGSKASGTTTGKADVAVDVVVSHEMLKAVEFSAFGGLVVRQNPAGYKLTNGVQWGVGADFLPRLPLHLTTELYGEKYLTTTITTPAGLVGADGSSLPTSTTVKSPLYLAAGLTYQASNGVFFGVGANWNVVMPARDHAIAGLTGPAFDAADYEIRIGYHPGTGKRSPSGGGSRAGTSSSGPGGGRTGQGGPAGPGPGGAGAPGGPGGPGASAPAAGGPGAGGPGGPGAGPGAPGAGGPGGAGPGGGATAANRPPTVRASCNPCTVEVGRASTLSADAQDPDGDPLTYQWTFASGSFANPAARQSPWTAPMTPGPVPFTVTVNDGRGGTARDSVTVQVVQPPQQTYNFEDVHFEFDRYTLTPDALRALDAAITAMQQNATLRLTIEGHTCNIGTAEYNLALGERRARAVRDYFVSRGIAADRLTTVSYGEERPKYDNSREDTRRLNRRAALVVRLQ